MRRILSLLLFLGIALPLLSQEFTETPGIQSQADIDSLKNAIKQFIWPKGIGDSTHVEEFATRISFEKEMPFEYRQYLVSLGDVDRIKLRSDIGLSSTTYVLHPLVSNDLSIPVIYLGGHNGFLWEDAYLNNSGRPYSISVLDFFLEKGFDVIGMDMPLCGVNEAPALVNENGNLSVLYNHDDLFRLEKNFYYFFEPLRRIIDFTEQNYGYRKFILVGLSGGGWTATLYSGLDERVVQSYSVAGSIPVPLRIDPSDIGDEEQRFTEFYEKFNYSDLYALASSGDEKLHYQILNKDDNCCFNFDGNEYWVPKVQQALKKAGNAGRFKFYYDPYATMHKISSVAADTIYKYVRNFLRRDVPASVNLSAETREVTICEGESLLLSANSNQSGELHWYRNEKRIDSDTSSIEVTKPGIYFARLHNVSGLNFWSDTVKVRVARLKQPSIGERADSLISSFRGRCQWYLNGTLLPGQIGAAIRPSVPGSYTVMSLTGNCSSDMSEPYAYGLVIYPNPSRGSFTVSTDRSMGRMIMEIWNSNGQIVSRSEFSGIIRMDISNRSKGIYFIRLRDERGLIYTRKLFVE